MSKVVLGLKLNPWHDTGAAIVADTGSGLRVVAISEERLDRKKHSRSFPRGAIEYCIKTIGCDQQDIDLVVSDYIFSPSADDSFPPGTDPCGAEKSHFLNELGSHRKPVLFAEHHMCHAASAFFSTDWDDAVALVIDGHGSRYETQSIYSCENHAITKLCVSHEPGIGWMYSAVTELLIGFDHLQEGKTMGLAGWTKDSGVWGDLFQSDARKTQGHETPYPQFLDGASPWHLHAPSNWPRRRREDDPVQAPFTQYAYAAQEALENGVMRLVQYAHELSPKRRLCYSGGVALNILANRQILDSGCFQEVFIQPAASDAGIPLGAALLGYYSVLGGQNRWRMDHAFLASAYSDQAVDAAVSRFTGSISRLQSDRLAQLLNKDYLVAWWRGPSEYGPRALGHRSILCSPHHPMMKAYLNREVKHREMFRPFAPIVPEERQADYFDLRQPSPFMLINAKVHPDAAPLMPAVVHADGTARVQSINAAILPELHELLLAFSRYSGFPVLLNTSLNLAGEPIVETPEDAISLFERSRLDVLAIGQHLLTKLPLDQLLRTPNPGLHTQAILQ